MPNVDEFKTPADDYTREETWPLRTIWTMEPIFEEDGISYKLFQGWSQKPSNGFPKVADRVGRYTFYDPKEILKWYKQWRKVNRAGRGEELNRDKGTTG